jgi:hypothetical protein
MVRTRDVLSGLIGAALLGSIPSYSGQDDQDDNQDHMEVRR